MMITPCIYYAILDKWNRNLYLKWTFATAVGTGVAVLLSMLMLCFQIGAVKDGFIDGVEHVIWSFGKRTYASPEDYPPVYAASLEAGPLKVVITYLNGVFFDLNNYLSIKAGFVSKNIFKIRYYYLIVLFIAPTVLLFINRNKMIEERRQQTSALFWTTWFSILGTVIVVRHLQSTLIHPYTHEFSSVANAFYAFWLCSVRYCRYRMDEKDRIKAKLGCVEGQNNRSSISGRNILPLSIITFNLSPCDSKFPLRTNCKSL